MKNKDVHVNSYVKQDGTEVREHFRSAQDSDGFMASPSGNNNGENLPILQPDFDQTQDNKHSSEQVNLDNQPKIEFVQLPQDAYYSVQNKPLQGAVEYNDTISQVDEDGYQNIARKTLALLDKTINIASSIPYGTSNAIHKQNLDKILEVLQNHHKQAAQIEQETLHKLVNTNNSD